MDHPTDTDSHHSPPTITSTLTAGGFSIDPEPVPLPTPELNMVQALRQMQPGQSAVVPLRKLPRVYRYAGELGILVKSQRISPRGVPRRDAQARIWVLGPRNVSNSPRTKPIRVTPRPSASPAAR